MKVKTKPAVLTGPPLTVTVLPGIAVSMAVLIAAALAFHWIAPVVTPSNVIVNVPPVTVPVRVTVWTSEVLATPVTSMTLPGTNPWGRSWSVWRRWTSGTCCSPLLAPATSEAA